MNVRLQHWQANLSRGVGGCKTSKLMKRGVQPIRLLSGRLSSIYRWVAVDYYWVYRLLKLESASGTRCEPVRGSAVRGCTCNGDLASRATLGQRCCNLELSLVPGPE